MARIKEEVRSNKENLQTDALTDWTHRYMSTEHFVKTNRNLLLFLAGVIVLLAAGSFFYVKNKARLEVEAKDQIFHAQQYFEVDSLGKAINGDGNNLGFEAILANYGGTSSANLAQYYLGACYLKKREFQKAIDHLTLYKGKDDLTGSEASGMIGDAYSELKDFDKATEFYLKAAREKKNNFTSPMYLLKAGLVYEQEKRYADALKVYTQIKTDFIESNEAKEIDKYIARVNQRP